jgi:hypothetical protein
MGREKELAMDFSGLRAWQWMIIGTLAGAAVGFAWSNQSTDLERRTGNKDTFRRLVITSDNNAKQGKPAVIRNIVVREPTVDPSNVLVYPVTFEYDTTALPAGLLRRMGAGGNAKADAAEWKSDGIYAETPFYGGRAIKDYLEFAKLPYTDRTGSHKYVPIYYGAAGGFAIVGLLWPASIRLLVLAGLAKAPPPREKKKKKPKHRTGEDVDDMLTKPVAKPVDAGALDALNDAMEANLAGSLTSGGARVTKPGAIEEPVSILMSGGGSTGAPDPTEAPRPMTPEEKKDYAGDYYPVARTAKKDGEPH